MEETEEKIHHYIQDHHLSYILFIIGAIFLFFASFYLSQFIFGIKHPDVFIAQGITNSLSSILSLILIFGYPALILVLFLGYLGLPVPATAILLAAGSFAANGQVNIIVLFMLISLTNIFGNLFGYFIGRKCSFIVHSKKIHTLGITPKRMKAVQSFLANWGMWSIFITHLVLTPIEVPMNVVAGIGKYPFKKFLSMIILAEILWTGLYLSLGYWLGSSWILLVNYVIDIPKILTTSVLGIFALYIALQIRKKYIFH